MIRRLLITLVLMAAAYYAGYHRITWEDARDWWRGGRQLFAAGVSSDAVVQLLPCIHSGAATPAMVERLTQERTN